MATVGRGERYRGRSRVQRLTVGLVVVGLAITTALSLLTLALHKRTEKHLLRLQVHQAATTLAAVLPLIQSELDDSLQVAGATRNPAAFSRFVQDRSGDEIPFRSVSLWQLVNGTPRQVALVGAQPEITADGRTDFLAGIRPSPGIKVSGILPDGAAGVLGYADDPPSSGGYIAYAESSLPAGRHLDVGRSNPFGDIDFALYLNTESPADLLESTRPTPIRGTTDSARAPFGDSSILLVATPTVDLAGGLSATLPWILAGVGVVLTASAAGFTELLGRRRRVAEDLADQNQQLYLEQRNIATTVQHALLPAVPDIAELEVGVRYLAGTAGMEIGGDWYDVVCRPGRCTTSSGT
jgi:hypothetical protein